MFQLGRYDPREEDRKAKRQKVEKQSGRHKKKGKVSKRNKGQAEQNEKSSNSEEPASTLRVIAPETKGSVSTPRKLHTKLNEEAFDDLDLADDILMKDAEKGEGGEMDENDQSQPAEFDPTDEIQRALHMSRQPIQVAAERWGLAHFLVQNLLKEGHETFFPIQSLVIPDVINAERHSQMWARDICVAAPTGSGKTLAFVLPVLNALANRKVRRLRALVVLPSRDLAKQVYQVFEHYAQGSDLAIGLAIGQSDFSAEQKQLILGDDDSQNNLSSRLEHLKQSLDPGNLESAMDAFEEEECGGKPKIPKGGISAVDVVVATPGRLVDHCNNTPGFTLQHLRFLVIDEADRLLSQSYHGWIARVLDNAQAASREAAIQKDQDEAAWTGADPITWRRSEAAYAVQSGLAGAVCHPIQLRKLLYSATLTRDPQKLAALKLVNPKHFNAHHLTADGDRTSSSSALYSMPEQLQEYTVECTAEQKPLVLLALLVERLKEASTDTKKSIIVVFTSSLDSTHRLTRLLQILWKAADYGEPPIEFSSSLNQYQRSAFMKRCNDPKDPVSVVICSDGMSRGMDIGYVSAVINYDVPGFAKTYVHRCGRTARAGKRGHSISLLKGAGQVGQFQKLRRLIDFPERVRTSKVKTSLVRHVIPLYRGCISSLKSLLAAEDGGELKPMDMDIDEYVPGSKTPS